MDDAIPVALEFAATVRRSLGNLAAKRVGLADGVRSKLSHFIFNL
jgi:hypothetical protein